MFLIPISIHVIYFIHKKNLLHICMLNKMKSFILLSVLMLLFLFLLLFVFVLLLLCTKKFTFILLNSIPTWTWTVFYYFVRDTKSAIGKKIKLWSWNYIEMIKDEMEIIIIQPARVFIYWITFKPFLWQFYSRSFVRFSV